MANLSFLKEFFSKALPFSYQIPFKNKDNQALGFQTSEQVCIIDDPLIMRLILIIIIKLNMREEDGVDIVKKIVTEWSKVYINQVFFINKFSNIYK